MKDAAGDREMAEMAAEEANTLEEQAKELEESLKVLKFSPLDVTILYNKTLSSFSSE